MNDYIERVSCDVSSDTLHMLQDETMAYNLDHIDDYLKHMINDTLYASYILHDADRNAVRYHNIDDAIQTLYLLARYDDTCILIGGMRERERIWEIVDDGGVYRNGNLELYRDSSTDIHIV